MGESGKWSRRVKGGEEDEGARCVSFDGGLSCRA
jgi:hypothetical protein